MEPAEASGGHILKGLPCQAEDNGLCLEAWDPAGDDLYGTEFLILW